MAVAVEAEKLTKQYRDKPALQDVSFTVPAGSALGLVGPNGAGKSTLLRMLLGVSRPSSGRILYDGRPLWPDPDRAMDSVGGFVDAPQFYPYFTARENLRMLAELRRLKLARVDEVLCYVHLEDDAGRKVGGFSHGMRQRLGIAAALLKEPGLLILDEPQDGLDPARLEEMRRLIIRIRQDLAPTIIMSSHVLQDIERLCDRIAVFDRGRLRYCGPTGGLGNPEGDEVIWEVRPIEPALHHLRSLGFDVWAMGDGRVAARWDESKELGSINLSLVSAGITIRTVIRRSASLESRLLRYLEDDHVDMR